LKVEVAVADISQSQKDLTIEVAADEVKAQFEKTYDAFSRYAKVPGFRPGRVPRGVVKQRFSKEVKDEVVERLMQHALQHAITDNKIRIIGEPRIREISFNEDEPLKFTASIEVLPEFELKEYKNLKATKQIKLITEEEIDRVIEHLRESAAELVPVEYRPSQDGDFVSINLVGKYVEPEGEQQEDLTTNDLTVELGGEGVQPEFTENLRGVKAGDVREFRVSYPEDFGSKGLAGKTLDFSVNVVVVREKELPEIDDQFAHETGGYETLVEMRAEIHKRLMKEAENESNSRLRNDLMSQILKDYAFEIPPSIVEQRATERMNELANYLIRSGAPIQTIREMDLGNRYDEVRQQVIRETRAALVLGRIGAAEKVVVSDQEIDQEIRRLAAIGGETFDRLKARLTKEEALSSIAETLRFDKVLNLLVDHAEVTVEELSDDQETAASQSAGEPAGESNVDEQT
jgi:trigger factor